MQSIHTLTIHCAEVGISKETLAKLLGGVKKRKVTKRKIDKEFEAFGNAGLSNSQLYQQAILLSKKRYIINYSYEKGSRNNLAACFIFGDSCPILEK
jgi:hypothetical protein